MQYEKNITDNLVTQQPLFEIMKMRKRWLVHLKKVPFYTNGLRRNGTLDSDKDLAQLATYDEALKIFNESDFEGIGFALGPDGNGGNWQGVDLDKVSKSGLSYLIENTPGYIEVSPSENGYHIIGYGRAFETMGGNKTNVEAYSSGRFFTFTGKKVEDNGLACLADFVEEKIAPIHQYKKHDESHAIKPNIAPYMITELRSALDSMRSDDYKLWIDMGMALVELGDVGRGLWLDWSKTSKKFNAVEASRKWDAFKPNSIGYKTIFYTAQERGWVNPKSNEAQINSVVSSGKIFVDVGDPKKVDVEYLDNPYIPKGQAIGFYGRGESGKSSFVATLVATNSFSYSTLWITSEESPDHIKLRHKNIDGHDKTIAVVNQTDFDIYSHLEEVITQAREKLNKPLGFIVLDAVVALVAWGKGESANDDGAVKRLISFIDRIAWREGVSILMIGHLNKKKGHEHIADAVLGATAWTSSLRLAYMLQKVPCEDYVGFIRTAKTNVNIHFGSFYRTVPVYEMSANIDGIKPSLCRIEYLDDRIYGERNLISALSDEGDVKQNKKSERESKIEAAISFAMKVLEDGEIKTRDDISESFGIMKISQRNWLEVDKGLIDLNVQISNRERNRKYYQLCSITPSP